MILCPQIQVHVKKRYLGTKTHKEAWVQKCLFIKTLISYSPEKYETKFWTCLQYFARIRCSLLWTSDRKFNTPDWVQLYLVSLPWSENSVKLFYFCQHGYFLEPLTMQVINHHVGIFFQKFSVRKLQWSKSAGIQNCKIFMPFYIASS